MQLTIKKLTTSYPSLKFVPGKQFCWSPETNEVIYNSKSDGSKATWSLLHETGHALLGHASYQADLELLRLEVAAWDEAKRLARQLNTSIDEEHIQDCLDTYRDWLYKRSICPNCNTKCLQQGDFVHYRCFNCHTTWRVTASRFCRAYRKTKNIQQDTVFHLNHEVK
jgi:hypothetical protein